MRLGRAGLRLLLLLSVLLAVGCAASPQSGAIDDAGSQALRLRATMLAEVPGAAVPSTAQAEAWVRLAREEMRRAGRRPAAAEFALLADRAPTVQRVAVLLMRAEGPWEVAASAPASTGLAGVPGYFITPTGVFAQDGAIRGYRALGTENREGIRGLGAAGMRVWDFGWTYAERGWTQDGTVAPMRFAMHATDPEYFEPMLGSPASEGCVRIGAAMNRFLDLHGVLDADVERLAATEPRLGSLLRPDRRPTPYAGRLLIVVDTSR